MLSVIQSQRNDFFLAVEVLAHSRVQAAHHRVPGYMVLLQVGYKAGYHTRVDCTGVPRTASAASRKAMVVPGTA